MVRHTGKKSTSLLLAILTLVSVTQAFNVAGVSQEGATNQEMRLKLQSILLGAGNYETKLEESFALMDQFFIGFEYQTLLPSALNCSAFLEQSISGLNETVIQWDADKDPNSGYNTTAADYIFNVTEWLSYKLAPGIRYCFNIGLESYTYYLIKDEEFGKFSDWFPAWLQNLLGNVVTFTALSTKIKEASAANNMEDALFWYGKLANIVLDFQPLGSPDLEFESDTAANPWEFRLLSDNYKVVPPEKTSQINGPAVGEGPPRVMGWADDTYGFLAGFMNVTFGGDSPNATVCLSNLTKVVEVSINFGNHVSVISNDSWLLASEDFQMIFETIHPIFFSCYQSGYEYFKIILNYVETFKDWKNLVYNLIHNIGPLYDAIYFVILHFKPIKDKEMGFVTYDIDERREWFFKTGIYFGTLIYDVFYTDPSQGDVDSFAQVIGIIPGFFDNRTDDPLIQ